MAAESTKRIKNQVVEPELCVVCSDRFTSIVRKKTTCTYCKASACSKCVEHYLLTRHEDAHCLHCRVNYNDTTLHEICTRTYLQQTYFKHRQEVLINRERANLPPLQEAAHREKATRETQAQVNAICAEISAFAAERAKLMERYQIVYVDYYRNLNTNPERLAEMNRLMAQSDELRTRMREKRDLIHSLRWPPQARQAHERAAEEEKKEDEKKRFVRRCTRDGCKGFLSTAWKCGMCEWYSCSKCFAVKGKEHDVAHECKKEDVETADLIRKDCKPCPKCGEFIQKTSGCEQMYCVCCQTPWDWITGKIVTSGPIHNPHYYEWLKRTGGAVPRNPNDVPCGGFPGAWELVRHPRGMKRHVSNLFYEFHRICMELQDISTRTYRSHLDQEGTTRINIGYLLGDTDEKKWGRLLATNEKKRKRDAEIQEVLGAFRMVAVELINRVQNYSEKGVLSFYHMHPLDAEKYIKALHVEITALINMINDAMKNISVSYSYSVPCIMSEWSDRDDTVHYFIRTKNLAMEARRKRREDKELAEEIAQEKEEEKEEKQEEKEEEVEEEPPRGEYLEDMGEQLQRAIIASLQE